MATGVFVLSGCAGEAGQGPWLSDVLGSPSPMWHEINMAPGPGKSPSGLCLCCLGPESAVGEGVAHPSNCPHRNAGSYLPCHMPAVHPSSDRMCSWWRSWGREGASGWDV